MHRYWLRFLAVLVVVSFLMVSGPFAQAAGATTVEEAVAAGQQYLKGRFNAGNGSFTPASGSYTVAATSAVVAGLVETGKRYDPEFEDMLDQAVTYILTYVQGNGGIYQSNATTYTTALAIIALSLYDSDGVNSGIIRPAVQGAVDYLEGCFDTNSGGWGYGCPASQDLSHTQFGVMGLWYGYRYLGLDISGAPWVDLLITKLTALHNAATGSFGYTTPNDTFANGTMTSAGLWSLILVGRGDNPMVDRAIDWFDNNYRWDKNPPNSDYSYYYFVFGMAKALTAAIGDNLTPGGNDWVNDLAVQMIANQNVAGYWDYSGSHDPEAVITTAWVLMALAFADPSVEGPEKLLADPPPDEIDYPLKGNVIITTTGGVTIAGAKRRGIKEKKKLHVKLPIGAMDFTLKHVPDPPNHSVVLTLNFNEPEAMDPDNPQGFLYRDAQGNPKIKAGLSWFKIEGGEWKGQSDIPIEIVLVNEKYLIKVTLTDGGPGDDDGEVNGEIKDPGAPGYGEANPILEFPRPSVEKDYGCFINSIMDSFKHKMKK